MNNQSTFEVRSMSALDDYSQFVIEFKTREEAEQYAIQQEASDRTTSYRVYKNK